MFKLNSIFRVTQYKFADLFTSVETKNNLNRRSLFECCGFGWFVDVVLHVDNFVCSRDLYPDDRE